VIGIIAVLIGILLPALSRARQSANQVKCMANMRSLGQAVFMYAGQYKGSLPWGLLQDNKAMGSGIYKGESCDWTTLLVKVMSKQEGSGYNSQLQTTTGSPGQRAVFICPEAFIDSKSPGIITQYGVHPRLMPDSETVDWLAAIETGDANRHLTPYKLSKIKRAAEVGILFDATITATGNYQAHATVDQLDKFCVYTRKPYLTDNYSIAPGVDGSQPVDMTPNSGQKKDINTDSDSNAGNVRFRHISNTQANVLMADGHVQAYRIDMRKSATPTAMTDLLRKNVYVNR